MGHRQAGSAAVHQGKGNLGVVEILEESGSPRALPRISQDFVSFAKCLGKVKVISKFFRSFTNTKKNLFADKSERMMRNVA